MEKNGNPSQYKSELPIVLHQSIKAKMYDYYLSRKSNHWMQSMGLYCFLYDTARHQGNIRVWVTDSFIINGTGVKKWLLPTIKKDLVRMGLIEIHQSRNDGGVFSKRYIEVKFVWKPEAVEKLFYQESNETTEYKIARGLLISNFKPYEEIESPIDYEFETEVNGKEVTLWASLFHFDDDEVLIAKAGFHGGEVDFDYTVPSDRVGEIAKGLAAGYKFSFEGILSALSGY